MENTTIQELEAKVRDYQDVLKTFGDLLEQENAALENYDIETVSSLYERKAKMVAAYRTMTAYFIKNQEALAALEAAKREALRASAQNLDSLIKKNETLLKTRMETSQNVMDTIINIAKITNNSNATSYGAQGRYSPLDNNKNALAINRTL